MMYTQLKLRPLNYKKNAISEIVAYAILISITLSLAGLVYGWLKFYATPNEKIECPDGTSIVIKHYEWVPIPGTFKITVQNKGFFNVDGFVAKVNPGAGATIGINTLSMVSGGGSDGISLNPNQDFVIGYDKIFVSGTGEEQDLTKEDLVTLGSGFLEIQPYIVDAKTGNKVFCSQIASQKLTIT